MSDLGARHVAVLDNQADADEHGREQLAHVFPALGGERSRRVLAANIFFAPRSFGGATVVAEQMARLVVAASAFQQFILTTLPQYDVEPYRLYRYEAHGAVVLGMGLPDHRSALEDFDNPATLAVFDAVLARVAPDLVHLHSIQGLGVQVAERCLQARIPFVVTLHDTWWICGRQFMIDRHSQYCGQTTVDLQVCNQCVDDPALNDYRQALLTGTLHRANLLLAPSAFCRNLYIANGFDPARIRVNRNGILPPGGDYRRQPGKAIRFGFVGGNASIKGIDVIARAFASLSRSDYELKVVDNLLHLGFRSFNRHSLKVPGAVSIVPGYTQANIDEFFAGIDVLLFPTQSKETFGLAVREALVRDVWVISTHAGGVVEDIVDGVNGTLIPLSSDEKYLREAVVEILEHPARYQQHRNSFKQGITLCSDQALELLGFYEEVLRPGVDEGSPPSRVNASMLDSRGF
ncbi:glycosyltransferase family 4 protein [Pseudomonas sp. NPDC089401]|uniref:glycosyltransferase family 4 protein n=1 Tax=Pseudomonas sp. NPDC089401 TaxID=3364462 RepID=UPI0038072F8F